MTLVGFKRMMCAGQCSKIRHHEVMFGLAMCVTCGAQRNDASHEPLELERFVG